MRDLWKNSHHVHESIEILNLSYIHMYEYIYTHILNIIYMFGILKNNMAPGLMTQWVKVFTAQV